MSESLTPEPQSKQEAFKDLLTKEFENHELPDEIFLLSGGIIKAKTGDGYKSLAYSDEDTHGFITGGKARIIAAAELGKAIPELNFVTTSYVETDAPTHAAVMQQELVNKGISPDHILLEEKSVNTATELVEMVKLAIEHNWSRLAVMTNDYHIPRVQAMFDNLESIITYDDPEFQKAILEFRAQNVEVSFIPAEEILSMVSPHYTHLINEVKKTDAYQGRIEAENHGLEDLRAGKYKIDTKPVWMEKTDPDKT